VSTSSVYLGGDNASVLKGCLLMDRAGRASHKAIQPCDVGLEEKKQKV